MQAVRYDTFALCATTSTRAVHAPAVAQKCSVPIFSYTDMSLEELRKKVIFHNSVDVWITACSERKIDWTNTDDYRKFISYLLKNNLNLKAFNLCAHEAGETEKEKTKFAEELSDIKDENASVYTIKLSDLALELISKYDFKN